MHSSDHAYTRTEAAPITAGRTIRWAQRYDLLVNLLTFGRENRLRTQTIQQAAVRSGAAVLDVGCGTGTLTLMANAAAGECGRVYGIDASPEMIAVARQKAMQQKREVDFQTGLIEALPFSDGMFDVVLSSLMFHHLTPELRQRGLAEIYRVLKPGGRLTLVDMIRPRTRMQRMALMALVHRGQTSDVHDLRPLMEKLAYTEIQTGIMSWRAIGFIQGSRAN